jgi:hypothetical protein
MKSVCVAHVCMQTMAHKCACAIVLVYDSRVFLSHTGMAKFQHVMSTCVVGQSELLKNYMCKVAKN